MPQTLSPKTSWLFLFLTPLFLLAACSEPVDMDAGAGGSNDTSDPNNQDPNNPEPNDPDPDGTDPAVDRDWTVPIDGRDPGRVSLHRLNRAEYNNTVRDLLATALRPADDFPDDDQGYGFDNIADVLSLSPLHLEMYERAAQALANEALGIGQATTQNFEAEEYGTEGGGRLHDFYWIQWTFGRVTLEVEVEEAGFYTLATRAYQYAGGDEAAEMTYTLDDEEEPFATITVEALEDAPEVYSANIELTVGTHTLHVAFSNDFYGGGEDRNLVFDWFQLEGPVIVGAPEILGCDPAEIGDEACARSFFAEFGAQAWRRPLSELEVEDLEIIMSLVSEDGGSFVEGISLAMQAILLSPNFTFRVELDNDPLSDAPHLLTDYELATRLSYFLWSSMPDDALFAAAEAGLLHDVEEIARQVRRMLDDERSQSLVETFGRQWLYIRDIENAFPDTWEYPEFDEALRAAMITEMELFFGTFIHEDRSMAEMLTAREAFVNERLALHYGIEGVTGEDFQRVAVPADIPRGGLLTQAGLLTALSNPSRTSVVRRGKWVLGQLLCSEPPAPPPGVESLPTQEEAGEGLTLRELMERHRSDPECASCHASMDPIGFGLENYNGIGLWRTEDNGYPIDAFGELPDGRSFSNAIELGAVIAADPDFAICVVEKTFTFAMGRGITFWDNRYLDDITDDFVESGLRFEELAISIATSDPFRFRRGETPTE